MQRFKILIYCCTILSEEGILTLYLYFKDLELFVLTYLCVTKKIPLNKGYVLCVQLHTFASKLCLHKSVLRLTFMVPRIVNVFL